MHKHGSDYLDNGKNTYFKKHLFNKIVIFKKRCCSVCKRLTEKDWAFAYIGANQDAIEVAGRMGIKNALNFAADDEGTRAMWRKEKRSRERYYSRGRLGISKESLKEEYFTED